MNVETIIGEKFRFLSWSKEDRSDTKMVDLITGCSCRDWVCRHGEYEKTEGRFYECKHQKAAWQIIHDGIRQRHKRQ